MCVHRPFSPFSFIGQFSKIFVGWLQMIPHGQQVCIQMANQNQWCYNIWLHNHYTLFRPFRCCNSMVEQCGHGHVAQIPSRIHEHQLTSGHHLCAHLHTGHWNCARQPLESFHLEFLLCLMCVKSAKEKQMYSYCTLLPNLDQHTLVYYVRLWLVKNTFKSLHLQVITW